IGNTIRGSVWRNEPNFVLNFALFCLAIAGSLECRPDGIDVFVGAGMARAGLAYAAMLAASVSAGALGYAVIWAYSPEQPAALAPSVSAAVAPPAEVAAQPGPGVAAPVVAASQALSSEPVMASAPAVAAAPGEPLTPPVAADIPMPRVSAAPAAATEP